MSATDSAPTPFDLLAEAAAELQAEEDSRAGEQNAAVGPKVTIPDPDHVIGDRPCPLCDGRGSVPFEVRQSPRYERCPDCVGTGTVFTGSFDPECATLLCERCQGRGFVSKETGEVPREIGNPLGEPPFPGMQWNAERHEWVWP